MASVRRIRNTEGGAIETLRPGDNGPRAVDALYKFGRHFPGGKPSQKDYQSPERTSRPGPRQPTLNEHHASYAQVKNSNGRAPDESAPQFACEKTADHNDASGWVRGQGEASPHPHFDNNDGVVSGARYSGVRHRK
jgi:hypothetical protein